MTTEAFPRFNLQDPKFNFEEYYRYFSGSNDIDQNVAQVGGAVLGYTFRPRVAFAPSVEAEIQCAEYPFILVSCHPSQFDPPVLGAAIHASKTLREKFEGRTTPWAKVSLFNMPLAGNLIKKVGGLPVVRKKDVKTDEGSLVSIASHHLINAAISQIQEGRNQLIFPEGENSSSPYQVNPLRNGVSTLIRRLLKEDVYFGILPIGIAYHHSSGSVLKKPHVYLSEPIVPHPGPSIGDKIHTAMQRSLINAHRLAA